MVVTEISELLYVSNKLAAVSHRGPWSPFPGLGGGCAGRALRGLTTELAVEAVGVVCTGTLYMCECGTFILLNWNIILQCYICE